MMSTKVAEQTRKMLEHVHGELEQRIVDLAEKAKRPYGGALSGTPEGCDLAAKALADACEPLARAISGLLRDYPVERPEAKVVAPSTEAPLHRNHPDRKARER